MGTVAGIIDIGLGNIDSVRRALTFMGFANQLCAKIDDLENVDRIIFPGVGNFYKASEVRFNIAIKEHVLHLNKPILGICLGMQLLCDRGYEGGEAEGLKLISGEVVKLEKGNSSERVPHMGWNEVHFKNKSILFKDIPDRMDFYFNHSYHFSKVEQNKVVSVTPYANGFVSTVEDKNVFGVQFHPEKSQELGLQLLKNFMEL